MFHSCYFCIAMLAVFDIMVNTPSYPTICDAKRIDHEHRWVPSQNLTQWYTPFDQCVINNPTNFSYERIIEDCESRVASASGGKDLLPMRCRAGNSWPSRSTYCSAEDLPFANRTNFQKALNGLDDPSSKPLAAFFSKLQSERGALLLIGDSVTQQFYGALACELEREGVWKEPRKFQNTDEMQYVRVKSDGIAEANHAVPISFLPIYHMVNGRWDRIPNANFHKLKTSLEDWIKRTDINSIVVVINMGLHYVDNPVKDFTPSDYESQMTMVLSYLHHFVIDNTISVSEEASEKRIRIFWRETSAQHFPTPNGYWPGQRYSHTMRLQCEPVRDTSPSADWRNRIIEKIVRTRSLFNIHIIKFYDVTLPLFSEHPNGGLKDCTHFCWYPMLYQSIFNDMNRYMVELK